MRMTRAARLVAVGAIATMAAACSSGGGGSSNSNSNSGTHAAQPSGVPTTAGIVGAASSNTKPVRGGTLDFSTWSEAPSLDPAFGYGGWGDAGDIELAAIYGSLIRYEPSNGQFTPDMAKSLTHNADFSEWTLKLRPNIKFTDGTPLNAKAVVFSMQRLLTLKSQDATEVGQISKYDTPDDLTVVFHLNAPWSRFPIVLAGAPGHIVSPTAVQKEGKDYPNHPVGAGPFMFVSHTPGVSIVLKANPDYWDGRPYLDQVKFVVLNDDQTRLDSLNSGGIQAAFLRDPATVAKARAEGYPGFANPMNGGEVLKINSAAGRPGADVRVRQAISDAINPALLNQRVDEGKGIWSKQVFGSGSIWHTDVPAPPYDPAQAKKLVAQAKNAGFNGKLSLTCDSSPTRTREALALQAQLNAVGFSTTIDKVPSVGALISKVNIQRNYDLACSGVALPDAAPWLGFSLQWESGGSQNSANYANPRMDSLIKGLRRAPDNDAMKKVIGNIEQVWSQTAPSVQLSTVTEFVAWNKDVHGIVPTARTDVLLAKAWIGNS